MKIYFDTEFTDLNKETELISIGLVDEEGNTFYGEITDFDTNKCSDFVIGNVVPLLKYYNKGVDSFSRQVKKSNFNSLLADEILGTKEEVRQYLLKWLDTKGDKIEWVSDCCHFDMVLLIDLLYGNAFNMPIGKVCPGCHDTNQDIARIFNIDEVEAFNKNREEIVNGYCKTPLTNIDKHNALYDAEVIRIIAKELIKL